MLHGDIMIRTRVQIEPESDMPGAFRHAMLIFGAISVFSGPALAGPIDAHYAVSLAGIPIGTAVMNGQVDNGHYNLTVSAKLVGIATMVSNGRGAAQASGGVNGARVLSGGYALSASNSQMSRTIQMSMAGGNIGAIKIEPPFDEKSDRIPVTEANKRGVVDPVSALVMPMLAGNALAPENCNRTIPVFDGAQRFDVVLSYAGAKAVKSKSFDGQAIVCKARYVPVAGHRPEREATKYMENNREMEAWLVPVAGAKVLVPYRIAVKTMIGTAVIEAQALTGATTAVGN